MNGPCFTFGSRALLPALLLTTPALATPALAFDWQPAERLTTNAGEDRTTSGSLVNMSSGLTVVWMQAQSGSGWRLMYSDLDGGHFTSPLPVDPPGPHPDFEPRATSEQASSLRGLVWQRGIGNGAEIMYASGPILGGWTVEPITTNASDIAIMDSPHVVWAGFDPISGEGKIFHAVRGAGGWQIERLVGSELGPFWTGATPHVAVDYDGVVHVVYRGGDFGDYHAHYARKESGGWTHQILTSGNGNDLIADVAIQGNDPVVAMSGNDGFGFPSSIYVRQSTNGGVTFGSHELASGAFSASLDNVTAGPWHGVNVVGSEVSGNIYTGNLVAWGLHTPVTELLPPANEASETPSIENADWITAARDGSVGPAKPQSSESGGFSPGYYSCAYTNHGGAGSSAAEIYVISAPSPGAVGDPGSAPAAGATLRVAPNPTRGGVRITAVSPGAEWAAAGRVSIYDAAGRLVRTLAPAPEEIGPTAQYRWDGRSVTGLPVAGGIYFLRLDRAPEAEARLTVVR